MPYRELPEEKVKEGIDEPEEAAAFDLDRIVDLCITSASESCADVEEVHSSFMSRLAT